MWFRNAGVSFHRFKPAVSVASFVSRISSAVETSVGREQSGKGKLASFLLRWV